MAIRALSPSQKDARYNLAMALMNVGAILTSESDHPLVVTRGDERGFKLKLHESKPSAPLSPIYLNLRTPDNPKAGPLTPEIVDLAALCMLDAVESIRSEFDSVAGLPNAGDPFAESLARYTGKPLLMLGKLTSGETRRIATITKPIPDNVMSTLLVDDLVTGADSKLEALNVVRGAGLVACNVVVLVDRGQGGRKELIEAGCDLHAVFGILELLNMYVEARKLSEATFHRIVTYLHGD